MYIYIYIYIYIYTYIHISIYIYIERERDRERERAFVPHKHTKMARFFAYIHLGTAGRPRRPRPLGCKYSNSMNNNDNNNNIVDIIRYNNTNMNLMTAKYDNS